MIGVKEYILDIVNKDRKSRDQIYAIWNKAKIHFRYDQGKGFVFHENLVSFIEYNYSLFWRHAALYCNFFYWTRKIWVILGWQNSKVFGKRD